MTIVIPDAYVPAVYAAGWLLAFTVLLFLFRDWPAVPSDVLRTLWVVPVWGTLVACGWCWHANWREAYRVETGNPGAYPDWWLAPLVGLVVATVFAGVLVVVHFFIVVDHLQTKK